MGQNEQRARFVIEFLSALTAAGVPYAVLRNAASLAEGTFKDVDLLVPPRAITPILRALDQRSDVASIKVRHALNRSQIEVALAAETSARVMMDLDVQIALVGNRRLGRWLGVLVSRSITFGDVATIRQRVSDAEISVVDPASELLLLRNHIRKKPKDAYLRRIAELEAEGVRPQPLTGLFHQPGLAVLRRGMLWAKALPLWLRSPGEGRD